MDDILYSNKYFGKQESNVIIAQRSLDFPVQYTFFRNLRQIDFYFYFLMLFNYLIILFNVSANFKYPCSFG